MTDDDLDLETLRARIRSLETQLNQSAGRDSRRGEITSALLANGCAPNALSDAAQLFESTASVDPDRTWRIGTLSRTSLDRAAERFLRDRPHLTEGESRPAAPFDLTQHPDYPRDYTGKPLPMSELTSDELLQLAGPPPSAPPTEKPKRYSREELSSMSRDQLLEAAGPMPTPKEPERRTYTPDELSRLDTGDLWDLAGPFPRG